MTNFDNHVYMIICDITVELYKTTSFSSYNTYCIHFSTCLKSKDLSVTQISHLGTIIDNLEKVFSMKLETIGFYISDYFLLEKYLIFHKIVLGTSTFFPNCNDIFVT